MKHIPFVDLKSQYLSIKDEIDNAIKDVIDETSFIGGRHLRQFEKAFSELYGVRNCIPVANGTDSLYIILKMLGVGLGDEVITSAYSWISSSEAISQTGATPVFVDIDEFFCIDASKIEQKISKNTKAIIPVHIHGQMCDMAKIMDIAKFYNLHVIEDCAQSHFSEFNGKRAGTFGVAGSFSFYPGKNLGAYGDAGCIISNDGHFSEKCKMFANHGALVKHDHQIEGINSRMDGMQAAILNVKLPYIIKWTEKRQLIADFYRKYLAGIEGIELPMLRPNTKHSYHLFVIKTRHRADLVNYLRERNIETVIHYPTALPFLPCYMNRNFTRDDFPVSYENQSQLLSLPLYPELDELSIKLISQAITEFYNKTERI